MALPVVGAVFEEEFLVGRRRGDRDEGEPVKVRDVECLELCTPVETIVDTTALAGAEGGVRVAVSANTSALFSSAQT